MQSGGAGGICPRLAFRQAFEVEHWYYYQFFPRKLDRKHAFRYNDRSSTIEGARCTYPPLLPQLAFSCRSLRYRGIRPQQSLGHPRLNSWINEACETDQQLRKGGDVPGN
jgi:hypothetical protein